MASTAIFMPGSYRPRYVIDSMEAPKRPPNPQTLGAPRQSRRAPRHPDTLLSPFDRDDLPSFVVAAVGADAMRELGLPALRAHRAGGRGELVVRPALSAARLGMSSFGQRHDRSPMVRRDEVAPRDP